jgi:cysteine desulfurase
LKETEVDLFALSGHKLHAPQGIGASYFRKGIGLQPFIVGGAQEKGRRGGTAAVPNIVGLGAACKLASESEDHGRIESLRDRFEETVLKTIPNAKVNGTTAAGKRLPNTSNISFAYIDGQNILLHLDEAGVCVSTGSACHSTSHESSPTLKAMNIPYTTAQGSIRFSLGRYNTAEEIDQVLTVLPGIIEKLAAMSPYEVRMKAEG